MSNLNSAVFLDRDGVLIEDVHLLTQPQKIRVLPSVVDALINLHNNGFRLLVASNQTVVARGLLSEDEMYSLQKQIEDQLMQQGAPPIDGFYACPHHPQATLPAYRIDCQCRKPRPGLILHAAKEYQIDLSTSYMVGDRITDIHAGVAAGCKTVLVQTGAHVAPTIQTSDILDETIQPDFICKDLGDAAEWILAATSAR
ncbi:MAG: HAD family hydrolase [Candidatus Hinthialibacter antarcticus]|nr:HAD family hydrolase [Candidatus Hinthialibacter antarcticus]